MVDHVIGNPVQKFAHHDRRFHPSEMATDAPVNAEAEGDVVIRRSFEYHLVRFIEFGGIAVCTGPTEKDTVSLVQGAAAQGRGFRDGTTQPLSRCEEPKIFLNR